ncbi:heterokaryon incompatibility protein-domain-containing protein, partial [Earliella scabrosa]
MWLVSTHRAELHHFADHLAVPDGGYAILSHTWEDREQSFQDVQAIRARCRLIGANPRKYVSEKIRQSCILAESYGYKWIWIDTCCIDKTSSSDLSEAINSMFNWYAFAEVCFAYLADVPKDCELSAPNSAFRKARWHTRGWTLQELIAPQVVIFISKDWVPIGNKLELAPLINSITGIKVSVLTHKILYYVASVSERMQWASKRRTTRIEDEAYCLLGLFNISMPTIYGEGREAFQRLQQEIIKTTADTSLFAWNLPLALNAAWSLDPDHDSILDEHLPLLASSPAEFLKTVYYSPRLDEPATPYLPSQWKTDPEDASRKTHGPFGEIKLPWVVNTNQGLMGHFPVTELDGITIAILLCQDGEDHLGLLLHPSPTEGQDPSRKLYRVGCAFERASARMVYLGGDYYNLRVNRKHALPQPQWRDIYIEDSRPRRRRQHPVHMLTPINCDTTNPAFRISPSLVGRLREGFNMECRVSGAQHVTLERTSTILNMRYSAPGRDEIIIICLGTCPTASEAGSWSAHWVTVHVRHRRRRMDDGTEEPTRIDATEHDCTQDHVEDWPKWTKDFGEDQRTVRLSFHRSSVAPTTTFVMHIELQGRIYEKLAGRANVVSPQIE